MSIVLFPQPYKGAVHSSDADGPITIVGINTDNDHIIFIDADGRLCNVNAAYVTFATVPQMSATKTPNAPFGFHARDDVFANEAK